MVFIWFGDWDHRCCSPLLNHEPALVIEWQGHTCSFLLDTKPLRHWGKWKSGPTSKRNLWPRHRPTGKCPLHRFEATGELLYWAVGSHILSRGPPNVCHHCGQTLTIDHMLMECAVLQECHDEYYTADSLNTLFETIPQTCIVEFLREVGFFYLIWMV